jgi:hypothetical protein
VIKPLTRNGASVLVVDHLAKNADSRSFGPTGTAAKMLAADGIAIRVTAERQFTPGAAGTAKLQVYKDRYGGVRNNYPSHPKPVIGTFELISNGRFSGLRFPQRPGRPNSQVFQGRREAVG